jgi:hypothetical protein
MFVAPDRLGGVLDAGQTGADRVESPNCHSEFSQPLWAIPWCTNVFGVSLETPKLVHESLTAAAHRICASAC